MMMMIKDRLGPEPKTDAALIEELLDEEPGSFDASDTTLVNKRVLPLLTYTGYTYEKVACPYMHIHTRMYMYIYTYIYTHTS